jgi:hypothetical protein
MICVEERQPEPSEHDRGGNRSHMIEIHHSGKGGKNKRLAPACKEFWNRRSMIERLRKNLRKERERRAVLMIYLLDVLWYKIKDTNS